LATLAFSSVSLHDALPIYVVQQQVGIGANQLVGQLRFGGVDVGGELRCVAALAAGTVEQRLAGEHLGRIDIAASRYAQVAGVEQDRKSTRLNSSHVKISYA